VGNIIDDFRMVKDPSELKKIKRSVNLISKILNQVIASIRPGMKENEIARFIENLAQDVGADGMAFPPIVASGPNSAMPHAVPTTRRIRPGEPIVIDAGVRVAGYCSDMTRTIFIGTPAREFKNIYRIVRKAQIAGINAIKEGVKSDLPDKISRDIISKEGFGDRFNHTLGHGLGLATHEGPRLGPGNPIPLKQGMVLTVEPGIYLPGKGGVRLEEMVIVGKSRSKVITPEIHIYDF
jgi:Xaa-Pro aminopeptidase